MRQLLREPLIFLMSLGVVCACYPYVLIRHPFILITDGLVFNVL